MTQTEKQKHARLSPSASNRWLTCPGSPSLCESVPEESSTIHEDYAREGTAAHELFEGCLRAETDAAELVGMKTTNGWQVDDEIAAAVQDALDAVRTDMLMDGGDSFYELEVSLADIHPDLEGTLDVALVTPSANLLRVYDLKFGAGIIVAATDNTQLLIYALGVLKYLGDIRSKVIDEVELVITQPRRDLSSMEGEDRRTRRWRVSKEDLIAWRDGVLIPGVAACDAETLRFAPSKPVCRLCPAVRICPAMRENHDALSHELVVQPKGAVVNKGDIGKLTSTLSTDRLGEALKQCELVELWISALRKHAHARAEHGDVATGWKLVQKFGYREWVDEKQAMTAMVEASGQPEATFKTKWKVVEPVMLSPAQAEKKWRGGKKVVSALTRKPVRGTVLVDISDKRPALPTGGSVFGELNEATQSLTD